MCSTNVFAATDAVSWPVGKASVQPEDVSTMTSKHLSFLCLGMWVKSICQSCPGSAPLQLVEDHTAFEGALRRQLMTGGASLMYLVNGLLEPRWGKDRGEKPVRSIRTIMEELVDCRNDFSGLGLGKGCPVFTMYPSLLSSYSTLV